MTWSVEEKTLTEPRTNDLVWDRVGLTAVNISIASLFQSPAVDALYFDLGSVQATWTGSANVQLSIELSDDGLGWCSVDYLKERVQQGSGSHLFRLGHLDYRYFRVVSTPFGGPAGTVQFRYLLKSRR